MSDIERLINQYCSSGVPKKKLGEVCDIVVGFAFKAGLFKKTGLPVVKTTNIQDGLIDENNMVYFDPDDYKKTNLNNYIIYPEDIVLGMSGTIKVGINKTKKNYYLNQRVCKFIPHQGLSNRYLYYTLCNSISKLVDVTSGSAVKNLSNDGIKELEILVPPMEVQNEIVKYLDKFNKRIELIKNKIELTSSQIKWIKFHFLKNIENAEIKSIGECCKTEKGKTPIQKAIPGEYPMVVTTAERKSCNTYQLEEPTVCVPLVSSRGHGVASLNQVFYQEGKFALGNILCAVTPKNHEYLSAKYLYYYLNFFKDTKIVSLMKGGANVSLTMDALKTVTIEIPSLKRQNEIINKLEKCDRNEELLKNKLSLLNVQYEYYRDELLNFKEVEVNE